LSKVCGGIPGVPAIGTIATHGDGCFGRCSATIRTSRSRLREDLH